MNKTEKIIIAGFSKLSNLIYTQLKQSHKFSLSVVDRKQIEDIEASCFTRGSISSSEVLIKAGIKHSHYLIVVTPDEDLNLMTALVASSLNPDIKIFVLINNLILSNRIKTIYENIVPISPQTFISPFLYNLSSVENSIGFFKHDEEMFSIIAKDGEILTEKVTESTNKQKEVSFSFSKKIVAYINYFKQITKEDRLLNYTSFFVIAFIVFMSFFVFFNDITRSITEGFYFAVTMVTTIGFGDINFLSSSEFVKLLGAVGMMLGAILMTLLNAAIVNVLVKRTLRKSDVMLSIPEQNHTIICGLGNTGKEYISMCKNYNHQNKIAGIDKVDILENDNDSSIPIIIGNAELEENLEKLYIRNASSLIITTDSDITNVNISLLARYLNNNINIITRIKNSSIARYLSTSDSRSKVLDVTHIMAEVVLANIMFTNSVIGITMEENRHILVLRVPLSFFESIDDISFAELDEDYHIEPLYDVMKVKKFEKISIKEELILRTTIEQLFSVKSQVIEKFRCRFEFKDTTENIAKIESAMECLNFYKIIDGYSANNILSVNMSHGVASALKSYLDSNQVDYEFKYLKQKKKYGKVLLCENEVASKKNILNLLESLGYQVEVVEDGNEVENLLIKKTYDILILNLMISGIASIEFVKSYRDKEEASGKHLFILGINDSLSVYENASFIEAGVDDVLERPFENQELETILDSYVKVKNDKGKDLSVEKFDLREAFESVDDDMNLFIKIFNKFDAIYQKKIESIVEYSSSKELENLLKELKKLKLSVSVFRIEEFTEAIDDIIGLAQDEKYSKVREAIIALSFELEDFTVFVKHSLNV